MDLNRLSILSMLPYLFQKALLSIGNFTRKVTKSPTRGQVLIEYVLLVFVVVIVGLIFVKSANSGMAALWRFIVSVVASPTPINFN